MEWHVEDQMPSKQFRNAVGWFAPVAILWATPVAPLAAVLFSTAFSTFGSAGEVLAT